MIKKRSEVANHSMEEIYFRKYNFNLVLKTGMANTYALIGCARITNKALAPFGQDINEKFHRSILQEFGSLSNSSIKISKTKLYKSKVMVHVYKRIIYGDMTQVWVYIKMKKNTYIMPYDNWEGFFRRWDIANRRTLIEKHNNRFI